ncbi:MAG: hypothetical protein IKO28_00415 [Prevotella sp.]|nr:hypothetical protein [Prevotella sp.]MBR4651424.1 hypothetical protein [Prevotella sp.]
MVTRIVMLIVSLVLMATGVSAQENANSRQAKKMFLETYHRAYSEHGASMHYKVNIANLYKTEGTIWYKGKKSKYVSKNSLGWNDGVTSYVTKEKKKVVEIYDANSKKKSKYEDKFKFEPENYNYSIANGKEGYIITIKAKKGADGVKEARVVLDKVTREPKHLKIKVAFIWANIYISDFKSGNIDDNTFVFPRAQYSSYKFVDKRD